MASEWYPWTMSGTPMDATLKVEMHPYSLEQGVGISQGAP